MLFKLACVAVSGLVAMYAMLECKEQNYQPQPGLQLALFLTGAVSSLCIVWLSIPEPFLYLVWLKLVMAFAGGYSWAYVIPQRLRNIKEL